MIDTEALKEAVRRAVENGSIGQEFYNEVLYENGLADDYSALMSTPNRLSFIGTAVIFSKEFAKAFFGEGKIKLCAFCGKWQCRCECPKPEMSMAYTLEISWKHHLKNLVLEENPITYLKEYMEGKR